MYQYMIEFDNNEDWDTQASLFERLAVRWAQLFEAYIPSGSGGVYPHIVVRVCEVLASGKSV